MSLESKNTKENKAKINWFRFTKTLKFRLTLTYSLILFLFTSSFVLGINVYLNDYFNQEPPEFSAPPPGTRVIINTNPSFEFNQTEKEAIREIRLKDLERIQNISVILLLPISLVSFALGYYLSDRFLYPLKLFQKKLDKLEDKDLGSQIEIFEEDEVGDLIKSFNKMSLNLKKSFDAQTQFVQDASHELKTPLTIIQTNLDFLTSNSDLSKKERDELFDNALSGMKRVRKLTDRLLDLTLPNKVKKEKTNLNKLLKEQVSLLNNLAKKENVKTHLDLPKKNVFREVDGMLLGRAVFNLLENAIKYAKDVKNPKVTLGLKELKVNNGDKNGPIEITVADNGKGIPKEHQEKVFERFYRVDKSRSRSIGADSGGFGLGLPITKKIVEEHDGTITLESSNKGTIFRILL